MAQFPTALGGFNVGMAAGQEARANEAQVASQVARDKMEQLKLLATQTADMQKQAVETLTTAVQAEQEQAAAAGRPVNWEGLTKLRTTLVEGVLPTVQQAQEAGIPTANPQIFLQGIDNAYRQTSPGAKSTLAASKAYDTAAAQASGAVAPNVQAGRAHMAGLEQGAKQGVMYSPEATIAKAGQAGAVAAASARGTASVPSLPPGTFLNTDGSIGIPTGLPEAMETLAAAKKGPVSKSLYLAVNPDTQEAVMANYDAETGALTGADGNPLPPGYLPVRVPTVEGATPQAASGLGTRTQNTIEDDLIKLTDADARLDKLADFDPEILTLWGKAQTKGLQWGSFLGTLSPEQKQTLETRASGLSDVAKNHNQVVHDLSGAAVTAQEAVRLAVQEPTTADDPVSFTAKLKARQADVRLAIARRRWMLKQGMQFDFKAGKNAPVSLDQFKSMYTQRVKEIVAEKGVTPEQAADEAAMEYGLDE